VTRLLDGRHHLERFAMEQAGEVDCPITWRDNEFVGTSPRYGDHRARELAGEPLPAETYIDRRPACT